jgi:hypothetical protein
MSDAEKANMDYMVDDAKRKDKIQVDKKANFTLSWEKWFEPDV